MRGNITRRGKSSWRLKFDADPDPVTGARKIRYVTVRGRLKDAEAELARLLDAAHKGVLPEASKITLGTYLASWLDGKDLSPRSREQYADIIERQINPVLGKTELQKLKPVHVKTWLSGLRARTVRHAFRVLHGALVEAVKLDMISRNVADAVTPPKVDAADCRRARCSKRLSALSCRKPSTCDRDAAR
jgi:hypothetical protein